MVKAIVFAKRKKGTTPEECSRYWYEKHAPLVLETVPGVKRYVQNLAVKLPGGGEPPFDCVGESWYDDLESWRKASDFYLSDSGKVLRDDEENFWDTSTVVFLIVEERVIVP